jgi:hypothetical protein
MKWNRIDGNDYIAMPYKQITDKQCCLDSLSSAIYYNYLWLSIYLKATEYAIFLLFSDCKDKNNNNNAKSTTHKDAYNNT